MILRVEEIGDRWENASLKRAENGDGKKKNVNLWNGVSGHQVRKEVEMYKSEACLANDFSGWLFDNDCIFSPQSVASEFFYGEGRTDFVTVDAGGDVTAFELKLSRWRNALHQAYRNSSFAHYSFVVMPSPSAKRAARQPKEFIRRGVGLVAVEWGGLKLYIDAKRTEPLRPWLTSSAISFISSIKEGCA